LIFNDITYLWRYYRKTLVLIRSFGNIETQSIWNGNSSKKYPQNIQQVARRKLRMINSSDNLNDLRIPPANHLEKLKGNLAGFYSIRINNQWRIIFKWKNSDACEVEIIDYH
jgi:proteic killer suppression protein